MCPSQAVHSSAPNPIIHKGEGVICEIIAELRFARSWTDYAGRADSPPRRCAVNSVIKAEVEIIAVCAYVCVCNGWMWCNLRGTINAINYINPRWFQLLIHHKIWQEWIWKVFWFDVDLCWGFVHTSCFLFGYFFNMIFVIHSHLSFSYRLVFGSQTFTSAWASSSSFPVSSPGS